MNWNEKAGDAAERDALEASPWAPAEATRFGGFTKGARWQREALLEGDVIERAARAEFRMNASLAADQIGLDEPVTWESLTGQERDACRAGARAALMAALEIEGEES